MLVGKLDEFIADVESGRIKAGIGGAPSDDEIVDWCEREVGVRMRSVPKVLDIFMRSIGSFRRRERLRLAVLGPRGGGKTYLAALIELVAYRFFGFDWNNIGASLEQAQRCYDHVRDAHMSSNDLHQFSFSVQAQEIRSRAGGSIGIHTASEKSIRGAHPVGPSGGGGMTLDEAALIPDRLIDASKGQLTSASPSALIQLSTMGERQVGRFWELLEEPAKYGYELKSFDVFDVAKRCPYDCATTCPVKEHFAQDYYEGSGATRQIVHAAYCGGKAHDVDGWIDVDEIAQQFHENPRASFERELMGKAVAAVGHVYDPVLIDAARLGGKSLAKDKADHARRFLLLEKGAAVDWGYAGATAICYGFRLRDALLVYRWDFFSHERFSIVRKHLLETCFDHHIEAIYPDSSNPSDNEELHNEAAREAERRRLDWAPRVFPVVFSKFKKYGIGEVRRRLEKRELIFSPDFGGTKDPNFDRAMRDLKAYHMDDRGEPIKEDDHGPDALLALCVGFSQSFWAPADPTAMKR